MTTRRSPAHWARRFTRWRRRWRRQPQQRTPRHGDPEQCRDGNAERNAAEQHAAEYDPESGRGQKACSVIEPSPQKNADTLDKGNALSQDGGKRATNRGTAVGSNKGRLPKTGEAPFALNFAGTAAGFLLAAYAVLGRRRKER